VTFAGCSAPVGQRPARGGRNSSSGGDQGSDRSGGIGGPDQALTDQHGIGAAGGGRSDLLGGADPGLGHGQRACRQARAQPSERVRVDLERPQVAGVDPDDPSPDRGGASGLLGVVDLDERVQAGRGGFLVQPGQGVVVERRHDQEHAAAPAARASQSW
jgi:hypothetical protein